MKILDNFLTITEFRPLLYHTNFSLQSQEGADVLSRHHTPSVHLSSEKTPFVPRS